MSASTGASRDTHVCPWWLIHVFDNPIRRLVQKPEPVLEGLVRPGDHCLDVGCGYGYLTIPMAGIVGPSGSVTAADLQPKMLEGVRRRAERAGLAARIRLHQVDASGIRFDDAFDFALAFWMLHEVPDQAGMLRQIRGALKSGGRFLLVEPKVHVSEAAFRLSVEIAQQVGLTAVREPGVSFSRAVLMAKGTAAGAGS